ncbi:hypothetical protein EJ08DRAFT_652495 [Tothia fuscella]|uniref:T6SS Phospholipase effector Tle1-like catalytic domain-containing protein n=1 Tax=Tothia fuscella TaxID=1048955 RepID=A0A9P4TVH0_9PEZI|nr:hypothetical protein EJ08DRAFT_652495 [Tothia fuscella]
MKKLIVCCDGTWLNSDHGTTKGDNLTEPKNPVLQAPSNVTRISRCIKRKDDNGNDQITYYQSGIGTHDVVDKVIGGATGLGLSENVREAYQFIAGNYDQNAGDEIYLVGFSRGSFTARSIASFISDIGLLTPLGMVHFYPIFQDWENQLKKRWTPNPNSPWKSPRPNAATKEYIDQLFKLGFTRRNVKVKAVAVYDTVGALGIPRIGILHDLFNPDERVPHSLDYAFVDTTVPSMVENAIHALALDEKREPFAPTMWEKPSPTQTLTQCWFAGAHSDCGGSYVDCRAADISLTWMISKLSKFISFDVIVLKEQYHKLGSADSKRPWACGQIHDPFATWYKKIGGYEKRTPMEYNRYSHDTGKEMVPTTPLQNTCEKIHPSVRLRMGLPGKGLEDRGEYAPAALDGWSVVGVRAPTAGNVKLQQIQEVQRKIFWQKGAKRMEEEIMSELEWELLKTSDPSVLDKFTSTVPKSHTITSLFHKVEELI